jgi:hypothetical protein
VNVTNTIVRELVANNEAYLNWDAVGPLLNFLTILGLIYINWRYLGKLNEQIQLSSRDKLCKEWISLVNPLYYHVVKNPKSLSTEQNSTEIAGSAYRDAFLMPPSAMSEYHFIQLTGNNSNKETEEFAEAFWNRMRENCVLGPQDLREKILKFLEAGTPKNPPEKGDQLYGAIVDRYKELQDKFDELAGTARSFRVIRAIRKYLKLY